MSNKGQKVASIGMLIMILAFVFGSAAFGFALGITWGIFMTAMSIGVVLFGIGTLRYLHDEREKDEESQ